MSGILFACIAIALTLRTTNRHEKETPPSWILISTLAHKQQTQLILICSAQKITILSAFAFATHTQRAMDNQSQSSSGQRDRSRRGDRGTRFSDAAVDAGGGNGGGGSSGGGNGRDRSSVRTNKRIYVSNIPYEYRWQDLKDLFRGVVGTVEFAELFNDENGKPRGCGIVEFKDADSVQKAMEKMNRYEVNGREIVVKDDHGEERDQFGRIVNGGTGGGGGSSMSGGGGGGGSSRGGGGSSGGGGGGRGGRGGRDRDRDAEWGYS